MAGLVVDKYEMLGITNEVIVTHPDTVNMGARVRLTDSGLIVEQWRNFDERLEILGDERLRD